MRSSIAGAGRRPVDAPPRGDTLGRHAACPRPPRCLRSSRARSVWASSPSSPCAPRVAAGIADARASFELTLAASLDDWGFLVLAGVEPLVDALERLKPRADELDWLASVGLVDAPDAAAAARLAVRVRRRRGAGGHRRVPRRGGAHRRGAVLAGAARGRASCRRRSRTRRSWPRGSRAWASPRAGRRWSRTARRRRTASAASRCWRGRPTSAAPARRPAALAARRYRIPVMAPQPTCLDLATGDFDRAVRAWLAASPNECVVRLEPARAKKDAAAPGRRRARPRGRRAGPLGPGQGRRRAARRRPRRPGPRRGARVHRRGAAARRPCSSRATSTSASPSSSAPSSRSTSSSSCPPRATPNSRSHVPLRSGRHREGGSWAPRVRVGDDVASSSDPGRKLLVRYVDADGHPSRTSPTAPASASSARGRPLRRPRDRPGRAPRRLLGRPAPREPACAPASAPARRRPRRVLRDRSRRAVEQLDEGHRRIASPARYPVGMSQPLATQKAELLQQGAGGVTYFFRFSSAKSQLARRLEERLDVLGPRVSVVDVIGVLPDVDRQERLLAVLHRQVGVAASW